MTTQLNAALFDPMLDAAGTAAVSLSLHTTNNGTTPPAAGADEVAGGSYARQPVTWDPATGGILTADDTITWPVPGGTTVRWCGVWGAGPTWLGAIQLPAPETFAGPGEYVAETTTLTLANAS